MREEAEHAEQQQLHERLRVVQERIALAIVRVAVRLVRGEVRVCTPGWQLRQVFTRFSGETIDFGFDAGSTSCAPWQLSQVATRVNPSCVT